MNMLVSWDIFKAFCVARSLSMQWIDLGDSYDLRLFDGGFSLACNLPKNMTTEITDFETNFKAAGNVSLYQTDSDGAQIVRIKAAKKGWSFWAVPIEINTSTINASVYCKDSAGNDIPGVSGKIYKADGEEITEPGLLNVNLALATKTVIDFEPTFDYEMIGGSLRINSNPAQDVRLWIVGAPDIPAQYGGSKEFASGINLKFLAPDSSFDIDGRVTKYVTYNGTDHRGKLRVILTHPAGLNLNCQIIIHTYRL